MGAYLTDHKPVRDQWYTKRNRPLTGCTVLHTAEGVLDTIGPDTGAETTAEFIRTRTTPGSYHDLVDSDSWIQLVDYNHGAYHDGTGSNNWALSLSFACRTSDWRTMSPQKLDGFMRQGARAFVNQQAYRRRIGAPLTELRLITKAQSDAGMSGFTYHGLRDPGRRSDPGVSAPNLFPFELFMTYCRAALAGTDPDGDEMPTTDDVFNYEVLTENITPENPKGNRIRFRNILDDLRNGVREIREFLQEKTGADLRLLVAQNRAQDAQIAGLTSAVAALSEAVASGRTDFTPQALREAVSQGIQDGGAALRAVESAVPKDQG